MLGKSSFPGQLPNSSDPIPGIWKESQVRRPFSESLPSAPSRTARLTHPEGGPREKPGGNHLGLLTVCCVLSEADGTKPPPLLRTLDGSAGFIRLLFPPAAATSRWGRRLRLVRPPLFFLAAPALGNKSCSPRRKTSAGESRKQSPKAQLEPPGERTSRVSFARPLDLATPLALPLWRAARLGRRRGGSPPRTGTRQGSDQSED